MQSASSILVVLVAIEHLWFLILEMFLFRTPIGRETFQMSEQTANACAVLAQNQGLYNGFLVAGLVASLWTKSLVLRRYSLICVIVAGIYGAYSFRDPAVMGVQSLPALLGLVLTELAQRRQNRIPQPA